MYAGERFNSISHLVGAGLAVAGTAVLVILAARLGDPWKIVSFSVYGAMLVALYVFSTLYHSLRGRAKNVLRKFDHCSIYLLIAGTYTPFALVSLRGAWGWWLFGAIWTLALVGIVQEIGVDLVRISPQANNTQEVIALFDQARKRALAPQEALSRLAPLMPAAGCNGYWHGRPGLEQGQVA